MVVDWGAHSLYIPGEFRTGQYYDYLLLAPLMNEQPKAWLKRVLIVGLAAGTVAQQITQAYGPVDIEGVEIDPAIVDLGRQYFDMNEPNLHVHATDGRTYLAASTEPYDWVIVDAYQGAEVPSHLITQEFFQQLKEHMTPNGVISINVCWYEPDDQELLQRLAATLKAVFPHYYAVTGISDKSGAVLLAGSHPSRRSNCAGAPKRSATRTSSKSPPKSARPSPPSWKFPPPSAPPSLTTRDW